MNKIFQVAGHRFGVLGENLCKAIDCIAGFKPFERINGGELLFTFVEDMDIPEMRTVQYEFAYEDVTGYFGKIANGFMLILKPAEEDALHLWCNDGEKEVRMCGNFSARLYRFALWIGFGLMTLPFDTVAIHSSCIVYENKAVLFLGESGTGKSTHTSLWRRHIEGAILLNDDSPILRVEEGKVWAYGSPWSGKTPCYKDERYELQGCVRLSQAPYNQIKQLTILQAYGAIHPSCPPEFAYDDKLYDSISDFINKLLSAVPFYHLACLPNDEAAFLSCSTLFPSVS